MLNRNNDPWTIDCFICNRNLRYPRSFAWLLFWKQKARTILVKLQVIDNDAIVIAPLAFCKEDFELARRNESAFVSLCQGKIDASFIAQQNKNSDDRPGN